MRSVKASSDRKAPSSTGKSRADRAAEFARLAANDARIRRQFVHAELECCHMALEMGEFELTAGDRAVTAKELVDAEKILTVIRRFLPRVPAEHWAELASRLTQAEARFERLRARLQTDRSVSRPPSKAPLVK